MISFFFMLLIQAAILGLALYFFLRTFWSTVKSTSWAERFCNFGVMLVFFFTMALICAYWYDTYATHNTLFSEPMHKVIRIEQKR